MSGYGEQDGEYRDTRHHEQQRGYGQPTGYDEDLSGAMSHAQQHSGESGDRGIFGNVLGFLQQNKQSVASQQVDEHSAVEAHKQYFGGGGSDQEADSGSMGTAAAMQALKMFTGGSSSGGSGGGSQNEFIGMAMAQASKLFEQQASQGNVSSGASKESAVQKAGEMALKFYMKSQMSGGSSGASGLMSMASKFL